MYGRSPSILTRKCGTWRAPSSGDRTRSSIRVQVVSAMKTSPDGVRIRSTSIRGTSSAYSQCGKLPEIDELEPHGADQGDERKYCISGSITCVDGRPTSARVVVELPEPRTNGLQSMRIKTRLEHSREHSGRKFQLEPAR